jgi:hypothetical protein
MSSMHIERKVKGRNRRQISNQRETESSSLLHHGFRLTIKGFHHGLHSNRDIIRMYSDIRGHSMNRLLKRLKCWNNARGALPLRVLNRTVVCAHPQWRGGQKTCMALGKSTTAEVLIGLDQVDGQKCKIDPIFDESMHLTREDCLLLRRRCREQPAC